MTQNLLRQVLAKVLNYGAPEQFKNKNNKDTETRDRTFFKRWRKMLIYVDVTPIEHRLIYRNQRTREYYSHKYHPYKPTILQGTNKNVKTNLNFPIY